MKTMLIRPFVDATQGNSPPMALMYLSSYLKSKGQSVKIVDKCCDIVNIKNFSAENPYIRKIFNEISDYKPDILGMTLFSRELNSIAELIRLTKKQFASLTIVLGGPHPTAMPKETLEQIPDCDFVVRGEGEKPLYDLVTSLSENKPLKKVRGISFGTNNGDGIYHCQDAEVINDLDSLPFPDRQGVIENYQNGKYASFLYGKPCDILMTSRGCPFSCHFCFKVCEKYRGRSAENVLSEIDWIVNNIAPKYIQIMDDSFTISHNRATAILDGLIERNYPVKFKVRSRVNAINEKLLKKMKQAGVTVVVLGLESGSQKMLNAFNKKTTVEQNIAACKLTRKMGLNCFGDMILFYPGETRETLKETEQFVKKAKPTAVKFYTLTPLPKTKIYEQAQKQGSLVGGWNIGDLLPWVKLEEFKDIDQMQKIAKKMFIKTLLNPARICWILKTYGNSFIANPLLTLKMISYNLWKKSKY